jgi:hypothetical protein
MKWFDSITVIAIMLFGIPYYAHAAGDGNAVTTALTTVLIAIVVIVVIFLICREIVCWYWKINQQIALLTEIRDLLASNRASGIGKQYGRSSLLGGISGIDGKDNKAEKNYCPKCNKIIGNCVTGKCTDCGTTLSTIE